MGEEANQMASKLSDKQYRARARRLYQKDGEIEIDEDTAQVSRNNDSDDHGAYVRAWVWVSD
jgi:hypothetical protein